VEIKTMRSPDNRAGVDPFVLKLSYKYQ